LLSGQRTGGAIHEPGSGPRGGAGATGGGFSDGSAIGRSPIGSTVHGGLVSVRGLVGQAGSRFLAATMGASHEAEGPDDRTSVGPLGLSSSLSRTASIAEKPAGRAGAADVIARSAIGVPALLQQEPAVMTYRAGGA